jgi:branched-subunit amino acid aminotransferase/4-amino-4-deoxychorismate lyase
LYDVEKHIAENGGYDDAMMFDWRGRVAEATGATSSSSATASCTRPCRIAS